MRRFEIKDAVGGAAFTVRIVTRAARNEIAGTQDDGSLKVRLTAAHSDGEINERLVEFLAERLKVSKDHIEIVAGHTTREKLISVEGINPLTLEERLVGDVA